MLKRVLCATDRSDLAPKLYRHATGIAATEGAALALVHVADNHADDTLVARLREEYQRAIPYSGAYDTDPQIFVRAGDTATAILACADECGADLIVCGSRRRRPIVSWLLGSASRSLLERTRRPLLVIPDNEFDIVTLGDAHTHLHFGSIVTAVDRTESNHDQLAFASHCAHVSGQLFTLMTVIERNDALTVDEAQRQLRERAHGLEPVRPASLIVRRGDVAEEIVRCCATEGAGLVVMGLRARSRGARPGAIASAVLQNGRAAVVAVPPNIPQHA